MKSTIVSIIVVPLLMAACSVLAVPAPEVGYEAPPPPPPSQSEVYHDQTGYGKYRFGYKVNDEYTGNHQTRHEERDEDGVVRGHYSLVEPDGNVRVVYYIADKYGFRAYVKNSHKPDSVHGEVNPYDEDKGGHHQGHIYNRYGGR